MTEKLKYLQRLKTGEIYFRKGGRTIARLPNDELSEAFKQQYAALLKEDIKARPVGRPSKMLKPKPAPGPKPTIEHFAELYLGSPIFAVSEARKTKETLSQGTQANYRLAIRLMESKGMLAVPLSDLTPRTANLYIQKIKREHGGSTAAMQKIVLSNLWRFARTFPEFDAGDRPNPMRGTEIDAPYEVEQEHLPWPEDVQDRFLEACNADLRFAFYLLLCTGQRISDVVRMRWEQFTGTHIILENGQKKDRTKTPLSIKVPKVLLREIETRNRVSPYMLTHKWGRPFNRCSLGQRIKETMRKVSDVRYTAHGLRKNAGITLAENGATVPQIMAALGHKTPKMALYYCRLANQRLLNDQAAEIIDAVFEKREAAKVAKRRAQIRAA